MAVRDLLNHSFEILTTFKPKDEDAEIFLQNYISRNKITDPILAKQITAVFFGCVKYEKVIKVVVDAFYAKEGSTILLSERQVYTVLTFIIMFFMDTIGMPGFRRLIGCQHIVRMHKFLLLICNERNLRSWMREEWKKIYDTQFVDATLLEMVLRYLPDLSQFTVELENKIANAEQKVSETEDYDFVQEKPRRATVIQPFQLTKPKPRAVPVPELVPQMPKMRDAPEYLYEQPKEQDIIAEKREENRRKAQALLEEANANEFSCAAASRQKPEKVLKRLEELRLEKEAKHTYYPPRMNPTPKTTLRSDTTIKLNTTAILREKKLCEDIEREQLKKIEELENGAFSDVQYRSWKAAMDQKQAEAALAEADRRIVEARLAREMAELARAEATVDRKKIANDMKEDAKQRMKQLLSEKISEQAEMRKMVDQIVADRGKITEAKTRLKEIKQKIVQEVAAESRELLAQALEEAETEMRRRSELIAHIRALESVPLVRQKLFDRTEAGGYGFLEEMSIAELEERIALTKASREKEIMERQDAIVQDKRQRQQMLTEAMDRIARHRMARSRIAAAAKLKEAADMNNTFITLPTASTSIHTATTRSKQDKLSDLNKMTAEKRTQLLERKAAVAEKLRSCSSSSSLNSQEGKQHSKLRKLLEEEHHKVFEKAQRRRDRAIGLGEKKDWDSMKLIYS